MTLPQRLVDDEGADPWLAERVCMATPPATLRRALTPEARARISARLATRASAQTRERSTLAWLLAASAAAALMLALGPRLASLRSEHDAVQGESLRPEPLATPAGIAPREPPPRPHDVAEVVPESPEATTARERPRSPTPAENRTKPGARAKTPNTTDPAPAWLIEARIALATDPDRTLDLIRASRDRDVAVSPELLELAARAVEARHARRVPVDIVPMPAP